MFDLSHLTLSVALSASKAKIPESFKLVFLVSKLANCQETSGLSKKILFLIKMKINKQFLHLKYRLGGQMKCYQATSHNLLRALTESEPLNECCQSV